MPNISTRTIKYFFAAILFIAVAVFGFNKANQNINAANCPGTPPTTPMFNIWPLSFTNQNCTDLPLIDAKNLNGSGRDARYALNQAEHDAGVAAKPGDNVRVAVYFHNGASPQNQATATARNVKIGVNSSAFNAITNVHYLRGTIKADNASTVTSFDPNTGGDINIRTPGPTTLKYLPGTTQLCISTQAALDRIAAGQNIDMSKTCGIDMNGQSQILIDLPDTISTTGEVAISDVPACFPFSGVVILTLEVVDAAATPPPAPSNATLSLSKTVRNISAGQSSFVETTNAKTGDSVEFKIVLTNTSASVSAQNLALKDVLPAGLDFVSGSVNNIPALDYLVSSGIGVGLAPNASTTYTFKSVVSANSGNLVNNAIVSGGNVDYALNAGNRSKSFISKLFNIASAAGTSLTDSASVIVSNPPAQAANITISKAVRNVTAGQTAFVKSVSANSGDKVEFQLTFKNTGSAPETVDFRDILPNGFIFIPGTINFGQQFSTMFGTGASILVGNGVTYNLTFQATVTATSGTIINTLNATPRNASMLADTATVNVTAAPQPSNAVLSIAKNVRNNTSGQTAYADTATAKNTDEVEFEITVSNTSTVSANNVTLKDVLPSGLTVVPGSVNNSLFTAAGLNIGTIGAAGVYKITFKANVNVASGTLINSASASGSNSNSVADTATVTVAAPPPALSYSMSLSKKVRDVTAGQTAYLSNINVNTGDTLQYQIILANTGSGTLTNIVLSDALPSDLQYVANSFGISIPGNNSTFANIIISSLAPSATVTINFNATVTGACKSITNTVYAQSSQTTKISSSATVNIVCQPQPNNGILNVSKLVKNLTQNTTSFVKQVSANQGDRIAYQIQITAANGDVNNVTVQDALPNYFSYSAGSAKLNQNAFADAFTSQPVNIGKLTSGQTSTIYFEGTVNSNLPVGQTNLINNASVSGDHLGTTSDSATVTVNVSGGGGGYAQMSISKLVRNQNGQTALQKSVNAQQNDLLSFQITVTNTGTLNLNNVWVSDILPNGLSYRQGSARVDFGTYGDQLIGNRLYLGTMVPGQQHIVTFDATVASSGSATYINIGQAGADNQSQIQDTATVFVSGSSGGFVNISQSKRAYNDTKNIDATLVPADSGNAITYTLTLSNTGNAPANSYVIADDLTSVLNYSDIVDYGGASLNGNVLTWPSVQIPAYGNVSRSFRVVVRPNIPSSAYSLVNTFGNTVTVLLNNPQVLGVTYVAPKTGPKAAYAFAFASFATALFAILKRKGYLKLNPVKK